MLTIDRLVLRLPDEFSGRGGVLGRAIGAALAAYRPPHAQARAELTVNVRDVSPAASGTAIADTVVRAVATQLNGGYRRKGPSS